MVDHLGVSFSGNQKAFRQIQGVLRNFIALVLIKYFLLTYG